MTSRKTMLSLTNNGCLNDFEIDKFVSEFL